MPNVTVIKDAALTYDNVSSLAAPIFELAADEAHAAIKGRSRPLIFLLCNFVFQKRPNESREGLLAKTTQPEVLRPLLTALLDRFDGNVRIRLGNAPLQSASWEAIRRDHGLDELERHFNALHPGCLEICDLRMNVQPRNRLGWSGLARYDLESPDIVTIDLGADSLLDEQNQQESRYRVMDYPPDRTESCHGPGRHVYYINRRLLEADLIISVPKLKTHEKVGMTTGIKGCVGIVAHKDCLAHHRKGDPGRGGDEYPCAAAHRRAVSTFHDWVYSLPPGKRGTNLLRLADRVLKKLTFLSGGTIAGSWSGNDTAWRMSLDLARILAHATADGRMRPEISRRHFVLTDGVVAGEGQGPLNPSPVPLGYLGFSTELVAADYVNSLTMGIPLDQLKIVANAFARHRFSLADYTPEEVRVRYEGTALRPEEYTTRCLHRFVMPRFW